MRRSHTRAPGQALVTMVVFALVFLLFVGLAIDSGMLYLERRHLQNIADAACLAAATEIARGGSATQAKSVANQYIIKNLDENARAAFQLPDPLSAIDFVNGVQGSGTNLTRGIEVNGRDVRVAVTFPAYTYFLRLGGIPTYRVLARAHCDATQGGGIWPVAINRFPGYEQDAPNKRIGVANVGAPLPQTYGNGAVPKYLIVRDVLQRQSVNDGILNRGPGLNSACDASMNRNWYDWPALGDPVAKTGPYRDSCAPATPDAPGYEVEMAGNGANPNNGSGATSYTGPLLLDARQISFTPRLFYNGQSAQTSTNTWKDIIVKYILTHYPGPDVLPGQELGVVNGVNSGQILDAIRDKYNVGDEVTVLIYNGQLYLNPDFQLAVVCQAGQGPTAGACNNDGSNNGKFVVRPAPPTPLINPTTCTYDGRYFIGDVNAPTVGPPLDAAHIAPSGSLRPAIYVVQLRPVPNNAYATTVRLTARLSGANATATHSAGDAEGFGQLKVKWEWPGGSTGWQAPDVPVDVDMPLPGGVDVRLSVIQTATEQVPCDPLDPSKPQISVPKRVAGAHTLQVIGRSVGGSATSREHSAYGVLGLQPYPNDYFLSFINDPNGMVKNVGPQVDLQAALQLIDANSPSGTALKWSEMAHSYAVAWYRNGAPYPGTPPGMSAQLDRSGQDPVLKVQVTPGTVAVGEYDIDLEVYGKNSAPITHSTRFHLRVEEDLNASIDAWVVALCYARFRITDMGPPNDVIKGRAISGCLAPEQVTAGLTARLIPW
ncbi:pilus assembly protein TadG-related protein [Kallotenue papyrolyticum]|uniref:pilus assembly protein TadG-related protein n=1 Tax=Kallotenue papyrolyticum TaxID=1325125 RepID=UPI0004786453|nr:Tad domain-containing protein [Kallotenue papyrolyticum]